MLQHIKLPVSALRRCLHPLSKETGEGGGGGDAGRQGRGVLGRGPSRGLPPHSWSDHGPRSLGPAWGSQHPVAASSVMGNATTSHPFHPRIHVPVNLW